MTIVNRTNQLIQLKKLDPQAATNAQLLQSLGLMVSAAQVITTAMKEQLTRQNDPVTRLWTALLKAIETQNMPTSSGQAITLTKYKGKVVKLHHRQDGSITLYCNYTTSAPLALWERDWSQRNTNAGKWELVDQCAIYYPGEAQKRFTNWLRQVNDQMQQPLDHNQVRKMKQFSGRGY